MMPERSLFWLRNERPKTTTQCQFLPFDVDVDEVGVTDVVDVDVGDGEVAVEARVEKFPKLLVFSEGILNESERK